MFAQGPVESYPEGPLILRFERQAQATPDAVAVIHGSQLVTYGELQWAVDAAAYRLRETGAKPGTRVAMLVDRSVDAFVGLLAILKVGAVYLPLDPASPPHRLGLILDDAQPGILLSQQSLASTALRLRPTMDEVPVNVGTPSARRPLPPESVRPDDVACVIYTSGSTGAPKGIELPHRTLLNRLHWMWTRYPFAPGEVSSQRTTLTAVDSLWELMGALLQGFPTAVIPHDWTITPAAMFDALRTHQVSRLCVVPSQFRVLLRWMLREEGTRLPDLRWCVSGGEPLTVDQAQAFFRAMPGSSLMNTYGTSEMWDAAAGLVSERSVSELGEVDIGRPLPNVEVHILDNELRPMPLEAPGEICVAGHGLGRGYVGQSSRMRTSFLDVRIVGSRFSRIYRTGDMGRVLPDGRIVHMGRIDSQVNIHGFRVEPGEVEAAVRRVAGIEDAAIVAESHDRQTFLACFYTTPDSQALDTRVLRAALHEYLPRHMVPTRYVHVTSLPQTASGKLDRRRLTD